MVHQQSLICSCRMWATSPGLCPLRRISRRALPATRPPSSKADQNCGISLSAKILSRLRVALRSTSLQGLPATNSSFTPHEKIAETAAKVWFATMGASMLAIIVLMSERVIVAACSLPQRGSACRRTRASACRQDLLCRFAHCSTYRSASSANVPLLRSAFFSAAGSCPRATASMASAASVRASLRPIAPASPMWSQRGRPWRL
jgi:hypothetical protein